MIGTRQILLLVVASAVFLVFELFSKVDVQEAGGADETPDVITIPKPAKTAVVASVDDYHPILRNKAATVQKHLPKGWRYIQTPTTVAETLAMASDEAQLDNDFEALRKEHRRGETLIRPRPAGLPREEGDPRLRIWNARYHRVRAALRRDQEAAVPGDPESRPLREHHFFTTDCTHHSLWQALGMEKSWQDVRQGGFMTRIVSGCLADKNVKKRREMGRTALTRPSYLKHRGVYYTPTVTTLPNGKKYAPYNRPKSIQYWMQHCDLTEEVFILHDPDMVFINPLAGADLVRPGSPAAPYYDYMAFPRLGEYKCPLCPKPGTINVKDYAVGPPWMLHKTDFESIFESWIKLVPMINDIDGSWIVEMVALSVACAFHNKPFQVLTTPQTDSWNEKGGWNTTDDSMLLYPHPKAWSLVHYCYTFELGEPPAKGGTGPAQLQRNLDKMKNNKAPITNWFHWSKYRIPSDWPGGDGRYGLDIIDCDSPIMEEFHTVRNFPSDRTHMRAWRRAGSMLGKMLPAINTALAQYKARYCRGGPDPDAASDTAVENQVIDTDETRAKTLGLKMSWGELLGAAADSDSTPRVTTATINLEQRIRTSHPEFFLSDYVITEVKEQREVEFRLPRNRHPSHNHG